MVLKPEFFIATEVDYYPSTIGSAMHRSQCLIGVDSTTCARMRCRWVAKTIWGWCSSTMHDFSRAMKVIWDLQFHVCKFTLDFSGVLVKWRQCNCTCEILYVLDGACMLLANFMRAPSLEHFDANFRDPNVECRPLQFRCSTSTQQTNFCRSPTMQEREVGVGKTEVISRLRLTALESEHIHRQGEAAWCC